MSSDGLAIQHVSDTAIWVAYYRAIESEHEKPLFSDPLAKVLVGERGKQIAESMGPTAKYTRWAVVIRTRIIDSYIQKLVAEGVDTVINLGAGLDTRPYRLTLPPSLRWIEVDYAHVIEHKEKLLRAEKPLVQLERISLDLTQRDLRKELFKKLGSESRKALILTEGVIPYLSEDQMATLSDDLANEKNFRYWIGEYYSPQVYPYFQSDRMRRLKNAPFRFFPIDWFAFLNSHGWKVAEIQYQGDVAEELGRPMPLPWFAKLLRPFFSKEVVKRNRQMMAYVLFVPIN